MAVTDQILVGGNSMFGIGLQAGKGVPRPNNSGYRWFSYTALPYGVNQPIQNLPPEGGKGNFLVVLVEQIKIRSLIIWFNEHDILFVCW